MSVCRIGPWHEWFAWRPVDTYLYGWKWLCTVKRARLGLGLMYLPLGADEYLD